jgi:hypothetical protein
MESAIGSPVVVERIPYMFSSMSDQPLNHLNRNIIPSGLFCGVSDQNNRSPEPCGGIGGIAIYSTADIHIGSPESIVSRYRQSCTTTRVLSGASGQSRKGRPEFDWRMSRVRTGHSKAQLRREIFPIVHFRCAIAGHGFCCHPWLAS